MKKNIPAIMGFCGTVMVAVALVWAFSQHGTIGLFRVNGQFQMLFILLGAFDVLLLALSLLYLWLGDRLRKAGRVTLAALLIILSVPGIAGPPAAFAWVTGTFSGGIGNTPPQLLITGETGANGIPDLAVAFNTSVESRNTLVWGKDDIFSTLTEDASGKRHIFVLKDLEAATEYTYRINGGDIRTFTTPSTDGKVRFAFGSDAHFAAGTNHPDLTADMLSLIADPANDYDMFFYAGDLVEYGFNIKEWQEAFTTFSRASAFIPTRFALGNHDSVFSGFSNYQDYTCSESMSGEDGSRIWYRVDAGDVHFLVLDIEWSAEAYTHEQAAWLEGQLRSIPAEDWTIVINHGFYYASGLRADGWNWYDNPETIDALTPLFEEYDVDVVMSGHLHHMELLEHNGVTYAICGTFGGKPENERTYTSPASLWYKTGTPGFVDVSIDGDMCCVTFRDAANNALHSTSITR